MGDDNDKQDGVRYTQPKIAQEGAELVDEHEKDVVPVPVEIVAPEPAVPTGGLVVAPVATASSHVGEYGEGKNPGGTCRCSRPGRTQ